MYWLLLSGPRTMGGHWDYGFFAPGYMECDTNAWEDFCSSIPWCPMTWSQEKDVDKWIAERLAEGAKLVFRLSDALTSTPSQSPVPPLDAPKQEVKAIAERMVAKYELDLGYLPGRQKHVSTQEGDGYRDALELILPHLLLMMKRVKHDWGCAHQNKGLGEQITLPCTCGLAQEQKSINELIDP